jgi:hypothetical protein
MGAYLRPFFSLSLPSLKLSLPNKALRTFPFKNIFTQFVITQVHADYYHFLDFWYILPFMIPMTSCLLFMIFIIITFSNSVNFSKTMGMMSLMRNLSHSSTLTTIIIFTINNTVSLKVKIVQWLYFAKKQLGKWHGL